MVDKLTVRLIVVFMGTIAAIVVLGGIYLADHDKSLTDALIALGGVALGNLGTFLVSTRGAGESPQDVTVVNPPSDPAQVEVAP